MNVKSLLSRPLLAASVLAATAVAPLSIASASEGHGFAFGHPGQPGEVDRTVEIEARDIAFDRDRLKVRPGETIRFVITNTGQMPHDFTIGPPAVQKSHRQEMREMMQDMREMMHASGQSGSHGHANAEQGDGDHHGASTHRGSHDHHGSHDAAMGHDDPNAVMVPPGETRELIWHFERAENVRFACNVPGHYEAGMHGSFVPAN